MFSLFEVTERLQASNIMDGKTNFRIKFLEKKNHTLMLRPFTQVKWMEVEGIKFCSPSIEKDLGEG